MEHYKQLERRFGHWMGVKHRHYVACASGTAALHLAMEALQIPSRSTMVMPDFTIVSCPRAAVMADLVPSFVDIDDSLLIDANAVRRRMTKNVKSILAVHTYGRVCDIRQLSNIAKNNGCFLIEDCAEAHGAPCIGELSDAACWSFYKNKIIQGEEGGMVSFADGEVAERARSLRSLGFTAAHDFTHIPRGHNYRLSNVHAFLILGSLRAYPKNIARRDEIERRFSDAVVQVANISPPRNVPWVYDVRIPGLRDLDALVFWLRKNNIAARHGFKSLSMQPEFCNMTENGNAIHVPNSREASKETFYVPIDPTWDNGEVERVGSTLANAIREFAPK